MPSAISHEERPSSMRNAQENASFAVSESPRPQTGMSQGRGACRASCAQSTLLPLPWPAGGSKGRSLSARRSHPGSEVPSRLVPINQLLLGASGSAPRPPPVERKMETEPRETETKRRVFPWDFRLCQGKSCGFLSNRGRSQTHMDSPTERCIPANFPPAPVAGGPCGSHPVI